MVNSKQVFIMLDTIPKIKVLKIKIHLRHAGYNIKLNFNPTNEAVNALTDYMNKNKYYNPYH
jgi:hypothetical protein